VRVGDKNKDAVLGGALDKPGASDSDPDSEAEAAAASIRKKTREANPLLVDLEEKKELSGSALASQWFSQVGGCLSAHFRLACISRFLPRLAAVVK
jgi:hypothetical protein